MAAINKSANASKNVPTVAVRDSFYDMQRRVTNYVIKVSWVGAGPREYHFNAGLKWAKLFEIDPDGDSVLLEVVKFLKDNMTDEEFERVLNNVNKFIMQFRKFTGPKVIPASDLKPQENDEKARELNGQASGQNEEVF